MHMAFFGCSIYYLCIDELMGCIIRTEPNDLEYRDEYGYT